MDVPPTPSFQKRFSGFGEYPLAVLEWSWRVWRARFSALLVGSLFFSATSFSIGYWLHGQAILRRPALEQVVGRPMSEAAIFMLYTLVPGLILGMAVFVVLCIIAPSQVHLECGEKMADLERELEREKAGRKTDQSEFKQLLAASRPKLFANIEQLTLIDAVGANAVRLAVLITMKNLGGASTATHFGLSLEVPGRPEVDLELRHLHEPVDISAPRPLIHVPGEPEQPAAPRRLIRNEDYLDKVGVNSIQNGSLVAGYVIGEISGLSANDIWVKGTVITFRFRDIQGQSCATQYRIAGTETIGDNLYVPGLSPPAA